MVLHDCYVRLGLVPRSALFPYTTLFRSASGSDDEALDQCIQVVLQGLPFPESGLKLTIDIHHRIELAPARTSLRGRELDRSEEHTSELQSLRQLVCRLLLEKTKSTI